MPSVFRSNDYDWLNFGTMSESRFESQVRSRKDLHHSGFDDTLIDKGYDAIEAAERCLEQARMIGWNVAAIKMTEKELFRFRAVQPTSRFRPMSTIEKVWVWVGLRIRDSERPTTVIHDIEVLEQR